MAQEMGHPTIRGRSLPPELEFIIIDQLSSDKPALASCSLVCSRWLPPSRRHLLRDITVKPATGRQLNPAPLEGLLQILQDSGEVYSQWAIGPCIKKLSLDGSIWERRSITPTLTCSLSLLCAFLSILTRLTSLRVQDLLMPDDFVEESNTRQSGCPGFELEELVVSGCDGPGHHPHHLIALLCTFSSIGSLTVRGWGRYVPHPETASPSALSPPIVRSLAVNIMPDLVAPSAIYPLFAALPSIANGQHLTRISVDAFNSEELVLFSDFASVAGGTFHEVELRAISELLGPSELLDGVSLVACTALRSLVLSIRPIFNDSGASHAEDTRDALSAYARFFHNHCDALPLLTTVRFELQPGGQWMLDAFVRLAHGIFHEWPEMMMQPVSTEEAERNRAVWASLEDALRPFRALERVEFVLYEKEGEMLTEEAKVELRGALERRLPRLWPSGVAQLVFEFFVYHPLY